MCRLSCLLFTAVFLMGCQPKVDNSDVGSLTSSVSEMSAALNDAQKQQLRDALVVIALSETGYLGEPPADPVAVAQDNTLGPALTRALDGEDFNGLIQRAATIRVLKESRTIEAAEKAKLEVMARIQQAQAELASLKGISIGKATYGWTRGDYMPQAVVEFELINQSGQGINGVKLRGDLFTNNREKQWAHENLTLEMIRALPDQASESYRLVPNQYSHWGNRDLQRHRDTQLELAVINVKIGEAWLVSADLEQLDKELKSYENVIATSTQVLESLKANAPKP